MQFTFYVQESIPIERSQFRCKIEEIIAILAICAFYKYSIFLFFFFLLPQFPVGREISGSSVGGLIEIDKINKIKVEQYQRLGCNKNNCLCSENIHFGAF